MKINVEQIRNMADFIRDMCGDDEVTFLDTLEGETDALELADMLIDAERSAEAMQAATKARIAELKERCDRFGHRREAHRATLGRLLAINLRHNRTGLAVQVSSVEAEGTPPSQRRRFQKASRIVAQAARPACRPGGDSAIL